jgi:hypothetical protein
MSQVSLENMTQEKTRHSDDTLGLACLLRSKTRSELTEVKGMSVAEKTLAGAAGGAGGTVVLSVLRYVLGKMGVVYQTAPMQVVERMQQADLVPDRPVAKRAIAVAAHLTYGTAAGAAFGALRRKREGLGTELAVGATLGVLLWGIGWAGWLPILGADRAPWNYNSPKALLPVLDHAVFGAAWGLLFWAFSRRKG